MEEKIQFNHQVSKIDGEICYDITGEHLEVLGHLMNEKQTSKPNRETLKSYISIA